ncbi:MAG: heparinase II/III family protein [bacterium]|nr:heparinase II/III family protein [bacterium]
MFPWLRRNLHSGLGPLNLEQDLAACMDDKVGYALSEKQLCAQFSGSALLKDAKALAAQDKTSEAVSALGEHFMYRVQPKAITHHSDISALRTKLRRFDANYMQNIIAGANRIVEHTFTGFNNQEYHFSRGIDWFSDFAGNSWPRLHISEIKQRFNDGVPLTPDPMGSLGNTWKLNSHRHFLLLGQAYWLTGNETYAAEFIVQAVKWCQENPPLLGVNWYDPLTVATRLVSWLLALGMFIESPQLQPSQMAMFAETLLSHGVLLAFWLQNKEAQQLPIAVALSMLADWMPEVRYAKHWQSLVEESWDAALAAEFNEDNFQISTSPALQIRSCEWLLLMALQRQACLLSLPKRISELLNDVLESLQCLHTPANLVYDLGGYPHQENFMGQGYSTSGHIRNLLALGAVLTKRAELYYGLPADPPELLWWLGENSWSDLKELSQQYEPSTAYLFSKTGLGAARTGWDEKATHVTFKATPNSSLQPEWLPEEQKNPQLLFHNDALSLTLTIEGEPFILEPGLANPNSPHDYRMSRLAAHSAPRLSNELEPPLPPAMVAQLTEQKITVPQAIYCSQLVGQRPHSQDQVQFGASRYAYTPDGRRVTITRHVIFMPSSKVLILRDKLEGQGEVPYECNFLLSPHLYPMMRGDMGCRLLGNKVSARIIPHLPQKAFYKKYKGSGKPFLGWFYAPNGKLSPANYLCYAHHSVTLPSKMYYVLHWNTQEADLPQPGDIDKLIGD